MLSALPLPIMSKPITLRGWEDTDAEERFSLFRDPDIAKYIGASPEFLEASTSKLREDIRSTAAKEQYRLALCLETGKLIGFIAIQPMKRGDSRHELVIGIRSEHRMEHHASIAARALLSAAFDTNPTLDAVYGRREWGNHGSRGLMRALRMRPAGLEPSTNSTSTCPDRLYILTRANME